MSRPTAVSPHFRRIGRCALPEPALDAHAASLGVAADALSPAEKAVGLLPGYQIIFVTSGVAYLIAVLLWLRIDATKPVAAERVKNKRFHLELTKHSPDLCANFAHSR